MLTRIRKSTEDKDSGFTLIELLVVMIIIGILAAIAIPVFLNQRKRAVDSSLKSDLRTLSSEAESIFTDAQTYPATGALTGASTTGTWNYTTLPANAIKTTVGNTFTYTLNAAGTAYCLVGTSVPATRATKAWVYVSSDGGLKPTLTACPATY